MIRALLIGLVLLAGASQVSACECDRERPVVEAVKTTVECGVCTVKRVAKGTYCVFHCVQPVRSAVEYIREEKPLRSALKALAEKIRERNACDSICEPSCGCAGV